MVQPGEHLSSEMVCSVFRGVFGHIRFVRDGLGRSPRVSDIALVWCFWWKRGSGFCLENVENMIKIEKVD